MVMGLIKLIGKSLAAASIVALSLAPVSVHAETNIPVKVGVLPYLDYQLFYVAHEKGFDHQLGYDLSFTTFPLEPNETRALIRGDIDIGQGAIGSLISQLPARPDLRVVMSGAQYKGFAFIVRKDSALKSFDELNKTLNNEEAARKAVVEEMAGKSLLTTESSYRATIAGLMSEGGKNYSDLKVQNYAEAAQAATAFIRGTGDIYLGAVAQTIKLVDQMGYKVLIQNQQMGAPGLWYSNAYVTQDYLDKHEKLLVDFTAIFQRAVRFTTEKPDEAYPIILKYLNPQTGGSATVDDLKNQIPRTTYFPTTEEAKSMVYSANSEANWKHLVDYQYVQAKALGTDLSKVSGDQFVVQDKIFNKFLSDADLQKYVAAPF